MRIAAALLLIMTVGLLEAAACPPGPCSKYRRVAPVEAQAVVYRRAARGMPPRFDRRALARFLSRAGWLPELTPAEPNTLPARTVLFVAAADVQRSNTTTDRLVILRRLEKRKGSTYVEMDGQFFELAPCLGNRRMFACLNRVDALPEADTKQFAAPP